MTVSELMRLLGAYPGDMRVVVSGYEEGYDDVSAERVAVEKVWLNGGTYEWQGKHLDPLSPADGKSKNRNAFGEPDRKMDEKDVEETLVIRRGSYR